jgi:hypothetical protein
MSQYDDSDGKLLDTETDGSTVSTFSARFLCHPCACFVRGTPPAVRPLARVHLSILLATAPDAHCRADEQYLAWQSFQLPQPQCRGPACRCYFRSRVSCLVTHWQERQPAHGQLQLNEIAAHGGCVPAGGRHPGRFTARGRCRETRARWFLISSPLQSHHGAPSCGVESKLD